MTKLCPYGVTTKRSKLPSSLEPSERQLSTEQGNVASWDIWSLVQRGLVYPSPYAIFLMCWRSTDNNGTLLTREVLSTVVRDVRRHIHQYLGSKNTTAVVGVGFPLWKEWCIEEGMEIPLGMQFAFPLEDNPSQSSVSALSNGVFVDSQGDIWFHIKSDDRAHCEDVLRFLRGKLETELQCVDVNRTVFQEAATKSTEEDKTGGKVLGCRFSENLNNPTDPVTMQENVIVGFDDPEHIGGSFVVAQRFIINWENLLNMSPTQLQDLVGRDFDDILIPSRDIRSHIKCARVQNEQGNTMMILRLGLPFGRSPAIDTDDGRQKGASLRDEKGIYFAGFAKSATALEAVMRQQIGDQPGFMRDRLLSNVRSDLGGFFYIPSLRDLCQDFVALDKVRNWGLFPGVNWNRLDRHFKLRSTNGYMYYNHKDYLFAMGTMVGKDRQKYLPPSNRVLRLMANMFSRWQDNWYFDRAQQELEPLESYVKRFFSDEKAAEVMNLSVVERMGWAVLISLGYVFPSDEYGYRGRRETPQGLVSGADTYRIHPAELIVGALPNIGLGQGRYVIDYSREDEKLQGFFSGITYASGIGHVIPAFQHALDLGLTGLIAEVNAKLSAETDISKQQFYKGAILTLEGVQKHCYAYARLAKEMAVKMSDGQLAERANLTEIAKRMEHLATQQPQTMLEAAQLIFTLHSCLHLVGEPTAIGRLDQMLYPFYSNDLAKGLLDPERAQEIIDCFWIKVGEKVQWNRIFVEDHQPWGNLAMGGASGNYPQGAANNQWVQQVTVGGRIPDTNEPAYNTVTLLCLRAARRLPLNAPCLSLRVGKDIPDEYLLEASLAILSGGAHPFLINDDKVIPGLIQSGERIGEGSISKPTQFTPVAQKAEGCWDSTVDMLVARDYACDGCFEPQLTGCNWFTLGGFETLTPLEAALNQGKAWANAGPIYFRGVRVSLTTIPPKQIVNFNQLLELFYKHLSWMYAKQADSTLAVFGDMASSCPAPLLSIFTKDCIERGLDIYGGGARYNVLAPCFTGLPNTINSLYAIKKLVFEETSAITSLPELVQALICNWGYKMEEPFISTLAGTTRIESQSERFKNLREAALALPKFGRGNPEVDSFGNEIVKRVAQTIVEVFTHPAEPTAKKMVQLAKRFGTVENPFRGFQIQPGVGTFENYVEFGSTCGASADGRLSGAPLASNLSPAPSPADRTVEKNHQSAPIVDVLKGYAGDGTDAIWDGATTDLNISEDFPPDELRAVLRAFAEGSGSNILTITCADSSTMAGASKDPEMYDLVRVRMGGWSEFFVSMFPSHQAQHERRPRDTPTPESSLVANGRKRKKL